MNANACSTGIASVSGSSMMSVFSALKPGRKPTTMPRMMPGQMIHHSESCEVKSCVRRSQLIRARLAREVVVEAFDRARRKADVERHGEEHPANGRDDERDQQHVARGAHAHDPEARGEREEEAQSEPQPGERRDEDDGHRQDAEALAKRVRRVQQRREAQALVPPHDRDRDARDLREREDDERRADDEAVRARLPLELPGREEEVDREGEGEDRNHEVRAQRLRPRAHFLPFFFAVRSGLYSLASSIMWFAYSVHTLVSPYWIDSGGAPVLAYSALYFGSSKTFLAVSLRIANSFGCFSMKSVWIAQACADGSAGMCVPATLFTAGAFVYFAIWCSSLKMPRISRVSFCVRTVPRGSAPMSHSPFSTAMLVGWPPP